MKILIAGGAGFLGTNLTIRLLIDGHEVSVMDNFSTGRRSNFESISNSLKDKLKIIEHDICQPLPDLGVNFDVVINMACPASPPAYQKLAIETLNVCSQGTENLLKLALKDHARLVHASTSEIYGDPKVHPQTEEYRGNVNSYGPRSMYDEGKRYAESLIWVYRNKHNLNTGIIRIFNTYGPFMDKEDGRVITNLVNQALADKPLTIYGDGRQTRSFCYVDDQINAWIKMIESSLEGPVNIGNPQEFTILELANTLEKVLGKTLEIEYRPFPVDDPLQRCPDISKAQKELNWQPEISLEEGLKKMIEWVKIS